MTVNDFLRTQTDACELCAICEGGWIVSTCWIDYEDLFLVPQSIADKEVKREEWGKLKIKTANGDYESVSCHYIYT